MYVSVGVVQIPPDGGQWLAMLLKTDTQLTCIDLRNNRLGGKQQGTAAPLSIIRSISSSMFHSGSPWTTF